MEPIPDAAGRPAPSILLIDAIERRIRSLGYEPVRSFDPQRRWRLAVGGQVIAAGESLAELARAAHEWLAGMRDGALS